jgi:hypothetical protein
MPYSKKDVIAEIVSLSGYEPGRIYMAAIYAKSQRETLSGADRNVLAKLAAQIKKAAKGER